MNARKKGSNYELWVIKWFKQHGWPNAVSSRSESKNRDDQGVDLVRTDPFNVQCKAVERISSVHDILKAMPREEGKHNVVFHKRNNKGTVVSMMLEDFEVLIEDL